MLVRTNTINKTFTATMAAEALPSTDLQNGQLILNISKANRVKQLEVERNFHKRIESNMRTIDGNDYAFQRVGLKVVSRITAPSSYNGHIGSVEQIESIHSNDDMKALVVAAAIKGYVQDQEAVTLRSFIPAQVGRNNVWMINCGRIITNNEMLKIRSVLKMYGINPDEDVALPTAKHGIDILDISGMESSTFRRIPTIVSKVLNGDAIACNNRFATEEFHYGYIGGDNFKSGQEKYNEIIDGFNSEIIRSNGSRSKLINFNDLNAKREENRNITKAFIKANTKQRAIWKLNNQMASQGGAA